LPGGRVVAGTERVWISGICAAREGLEVNLLGPSLGVDPVRPVLKLPAFGRLGMVHL
jgi:hypothetical protein